MSFETVVVVVAQMKLERPWKKVILYIQDVKLKLFSLLTRFLEIRYQAILRGQIQVEL